MPVIFSTIPSLPLKINTTITHPGATPESNLALHFCLSCPVRHGPVTTKRICWGALVPPPQLEGKAGREKQVPLS
jgi:hypothetical protein